MKTQYEQNSDFSASENITQIPTYIRSGDIPKGCNVPSGIRVSVEMTNGNGLVIMTNGKRHLEAQVSSDELRALADALDKAIQVGKELDY